MKRLVYLCVVGLLLASATAAQADIFQWEYIDPADPSQGKQQSATLAPDGAGVDAVPYALLYGRNLTMAYLIGADLRDAAMTGNLSSADLSQANLTGANLGLATLTGANFTDSEVRGASFERNASYNMGTGIAAAQLYSTASYRAGDLSGIGLLENNLTGVDLAGQNLADANLRRATLPGANLSQANFTNATLEGADLNGADFSQANLTGAKLGLTTLAGANFTGAEVRHADFFRNPSWGDQATTGITTAQLHSTASYLARDLTGVSFYGNNLTGANLTGQNLTDANFERATLAGANFHQAHLANVLMEAADLTGSDLSQANLTNAELVGAAISGANFAGAEVRGANFTRDSTYFGQAGTGITLPQLYATASYQARDLTGVNFTGNNLAGADFAGQTLVGSVFSRSIAGDGDLSGANFSGADARGTNFAGAKLTGADMSLATLTRANFRFATLVQANLSKIDLSDASLDYSNLTGANLRQANLQNVTSEGANLTNADLSHANLTAASFINVPFTGADFTGAELRGALLFSSAGGRMTTAQLYSTASYQAHDLSETRFLGSAFAGANLADFTLTGASFDGCDLTSANFSRANLTNASFYATLTDADFSGAVVRGASFPTISLAQLSSTASYQAHDLTGIRLGGDLSGGNFAGQNLTNASLVAATLTNANLSQANLANANLTAAGMTGANLTQANLSNANLYAATLTGADLSQANLTGADFTSATLTGANLIGAEVRGATLFITTAQLYSTASYQAHDLTGIGLHGNNLAGADFVGQNLTNANFSSTALFNANFVGAEVRGANFDYSAITKAQLYSTASYQDHDLTGIRLNGKNLANWNFAGQNLTNASFRFATLTGANFSQANLTNADFFHFWTDLTGANLSQANLAGANLDSTTLTRANFSQANLTGANLFFTKLTRANFNQANLTSANLSYANLTGASLSEAVLTDAVVKNAKLSSTHITLDQLYSTASYRDHDLAGVQFVGNDLSGANLAGQVLAGSSFYAAKLVGANLTNANLTYAELVNADLSQANLTGANLTLGALALANLSGANLINANLSGTNFIGANLTGADIRGANFSQVIVPVVVEVPYGAPCGPKYNTGDSGVGCNFSTLHTVGTGISLAQLVSTASYGAHDLSGVTLVNNIFNGGNFAGFNLTNTNFSGSLLVGADFSGADSRGAIGLAGFAAPNLVRPDGHIIGLNLTAGQTLSVRDYDGTPASGIIRIHVDQRLVMVPGATLRMIFEADAWDSTISFEAGIPVMLGGSVDLAFAADVNLLSQIGRTFHVFDWTGVTPTGAFAVDGPYLWDLSNLYTSGEITFLAASGLPGDFNADGSVDTADYVVWRKGLGPNYSPLAINVWRAHLGLSDGSGNGSAVELLDNQVPEPTSLALSLVTIGLVAAWTTRRARRRRKLAPVLRSACYRLSILGLLVLACNRSFAAPPEIQLTKIGAPVWKPVDFQLFSAPATPFDAAFGQVYNTLLPYDTPLATSYTPHDPPYYTELSAGMIAGGYVSKSVFTTDAITLNPSGVYFAYTLVPDPGITGSSRDFAAGPVIPNSLFPLAANYDVWLDGVLVDRAPGADAITPVQPRDVGHDGTSHLEALQVFWHPWDDDLTVGPLGNYDLRASIRDVGGSGWDVVAPFQVVAELPGDFNHDGTVDAADYVVWRKTNAGNAQGYTAWRTNFGEGLDAGGGSAGASRSPSAVPEPATLVLLMLTAAGWCLRRGRASEKVPSSR